MGVIIVAGALANKYRNGGGTWERMSWVIGLMRLHFDVYFVEQINPEACVDAAGNITSFTGSVNFAWFQSVTEWFGIADRSALVYSEGAQSVGVPWPRLLELAESAVLLVNLGGHLTLETLLGRIQCKAYIDVDPGFTQFWHADPNVPFHLSGHDFYFTIGENIGLPECSIPTCGIQWRPIRQPVVLDEWPVIKRETLGRFTTVGSWRGSYGPVHAHGKTYGLKVHEFRKFIPIPRRSSHPFEIALEIHPGDDKDRIILERHGWWLVDPKQTVGDPAAFRHYIQQSGAEFSVAQGIYVETNSGWFSDRTVRYLASGRPALVQDTGFGRHYPAGEGLVAFRTLDEAIEGAESIARDYEKHCRTARRLAETFFDSDKVLRWLASETGVNLP